jgi:hypothetical protein
VGLTVLRLIIGHLLRVGAPLVIAVDDTMFCRSGRRVYADMPRRGYYGSLKVAKGNQKLSRGNTFVVAGSCSRCRSWTGPSRCRPGPAVAQRRTCSEDLYVDQGKRWES